MSLTTAFRTLISLCALSCCLSGALARQKSENAASLSYGDVKVQKIGRVKGNIDFSGLELVGKETLITVPYARSNATLQVHADRIVTTEKDKDKFAVTRLEGNVKYLITQKLPQGGERIMQGTAQRGFFQRSDQRIELTGAVRATIKDTDNLGAPANVEAGKATIDLSARPYLYTLSGSSAETKIQISPKRRKPREGATAKAFSGDIHASGYDTATFQQGKEATFLGAKTVLEIENPEDRSRLVLRSPNIRVSLQGADATLDRADMKGGVQFSLERIGKDAKGKETQEKTEGSSTSALYVAKEKRMEFLGGVSIRLATSALQAPATLRATKLTMRTEAPYRYDLEADPRIAEAVFQPLAPPAPKPSADGKPQAAPFLLGVVTITNFSKGSFEEGKEAHFEGDRLVFETKNPATDSYSRFQAKSISAQFSEKSVMKRAEATGNVEYRFQHRAQKDRPAQIVRGVATSVIFREEGEKRNIDVTGPFRAEIFAPEQLEEPGIVKGLAGDKMILILSENSYAFEIESEKETAELQFKPKETKKEGEAESQTPKGKPLTPKKG